MWSIPFLIVLIGPLKFLPTSLPALKSVTFTCFYVFKFQFIFNTLVFLSVQKKSNFFFNIIHYLPNPCLVDCVSSNTSSISFAPCILPPHKLYTLIQKVLWQPKWFWWGTQRFHSLAMCVNHWVHTKPRRNHSTLIITILSDTSFKGISENVLLMGCSLFGTLGTSTWEGNYPSTYLRVVWSLSLFMYDFIILF